MRTESVKRLHQNYQINTMNKIKTYSCPWTLANEMYPEIDKEIIDEMLFCEITELITNYEEIDI